VTGSGPTNVVYLQSVNETAAALETNLKSGLTAPEAAARLQRCGPNELEAEKPPPEWQRFLQQFRDPLVLLLLAAAGISLAVWTLEAESALPYESIVIFIIVLLNALLSFVQEGKAQQALAQLRAMAAPEAIIVRDGQQLRVPTRILVPGDLLILSEGDTIAADARIIESVELRTLEASLTGESTPVSKDVKPLDHEAAVGDRRNMVFSGTTIAFGHGRAIVTTTGMRTETGKIAGLLRRVPPQPTPLQVELARVGRQLGIGVIVIATVVVLTLLSIRGIGSGPGDLVHTLMFGVALAVAAAPEGLAAVVTVVLAIGVQRMAGRGAIIRKLPAVETLGSVTVIASDKTGTLTRNQMTVRAIVTASGRFELPGAGYDPTGELSAARLSPEHRKEAEVLLRSAALANNALLVETEGLWDIHGDPTEGALLVAAHKAGLEHGELNERFPRVAEMPFSSDRKRMSTLHHDATHPEKLFVFVKGAPGPLLDLCTSEFAADCSRPLTAERKKLIVQDAEALAGEALRTLGIAQRRVTPRDAESPNSDGLEQDLEFVGLVGMIDPPRQEAFAAIEKAKTAGVRPVMITGDHAATARAIAAELGILSDFGQKILSGQDIDRMSDTDLATAAAQTAVYARVNPEHKLRIVRALQSNGAIVAMTGDGVNDAPALQSADIGIAMSITGTGVAKEASDLVLTDDNFATIVAAVEEGRGVYENIRKFLRYLLSSNAGEVLTIFFAVVFAGPLGLNTEQGLPLLPLLAAQILWINLVTDGAPALALGLDPPENDLMRQPPRSRGEGVINRRMLFDVVLLGLVMAIGTLLVFDAALPGGLIAGTGSVLYARTMAFSTLIFFQVFNAFNSRSDHHSVVRGLFANHWLWAAALLSVSLHLLVVYLPFLQVAFGTVALALSDWVRCIAVASSVIWVAEAVKVSRR
jgi:Ca2+-transporting ATPase